MLRKYASVRLAWGQTTLERNHVIRGLTALVVNVKISTVNWVSLYLTDQRCSWLSMTSVFTSKSWRRITCDYVPSKFSSCVTARTRAIGLSPSPYRVTCTTEEDRRKHYSLLDLPSLYSLTLNPLRWKIWWAPNNASRRQMGINSAFKGLKWSQFCLFFDCLAYDVTNKTDLHTILFRLTAHSSRCLRRCLTVKRPAWLIQF